MDPVIVAGAGPVGLALSLSLASYGVPTVVLDGALPDADPRPARSVVLRPRTVGFLARLGCAGLEEHGVRLEGWRAVRGTRTLETAGYPDGPPLHLPQSALTWALRTALEEHKDAELVAAGRVDALEAEDAGVTVHSRPLAGGEDTGTWWRGGYLVGCDGARSTVRKLMDVRFAGRTAVERHAVAVLRAELPWGAEEVLHRGPVRHAGGPQITARPLAGSSGGPGGASEGGVWRLDWLLPAGDDRLVTPEAILRRITATLALWCGRDTVPYSLLDTGVHTVHHRLARRWRQGRVLLAGDAAHLHGTLGVQQLDEGLRDAENLAWKLAFVLQHSAGDGLLDSYEEERRGAVSRRLRAADQALPLLRPGGSVRSAVRGGRGLGMYADGFLGRGAVGGPDVYAAPAPERSVAVGTPVGALVADVPVTGPDGEESSLHAHVGRGLLAVLLAPGTRVWARSHWLGAGLMPKLTAALDRLPLRTELLVAEDYPGAPAHTLLLVRPDGHLLAALPGIDADELRRCVASLTG